MSKRKDSADQIQLRGAREHNLKNIDLDLPKNKLVAITGPSGSGKSTLAFDLIYAEAKRLLLENLSLEARVFMEQIPKPRFDSISGLSPAIGLAQERITARSRSTIGTYSDVYDYLSLLYAKLGEPHCPDCGKKLERHSASAIAKKIAAKPIGSKLLLLAPVVYKKKGTHREKLEQLLKEGFLRVRIDGELYLLEDEISLENDEEHCIEVLLDRVVLKEGISQRIAESVETCLKLSGGLVEVCEASQDLQETGELYSEKFLCRECDFELSELDTSLFSFNHPKGACAKCSGLGTIEEEGRSDARQDCRACQGTRLRAESRAVLLRGKSIDELSSLGIAQLSTYLKNLKFEESEKNISRVLLEQMLEKLAALEDSGLGYLTLARRLSTLSSGESRRIQLSTQVNSKLSGILYIIDEPSIGLHAKELSWLKDAIFSLLERGNSVLMVEHEATLIESADHVVELGPGAGESGGQLIACGSVAQLKNNPSSPTGQYLASSSSTAATEARKRKSKGSLKVKTASEFNLKNLEIDIPLGVLTTLVGVSGSGKSNLLSEVLLKHLRARQNGETIKGSSSISIKGTEDFGSFIFIDSDAIGRSSRSNPATYTGLLDVIRSTFSELPEARVRGYGPARFSFNVKGGRCEACKGAGLRRVELELLPDLEVECDECAGKRYNRETLEIRYKGFSISEILEMSASRALEVLGNIPKAGAILRSLVEVGLGYLKLGQAATTLSGGEAQRVKLACELGKKQSSQTLYILDEPSIGLGFSDVANLIQILNRLLDEGHSVLLAEHNTDLIRASDWLIELGPGGGEYGGQLIAEGTVAELKTSKKSITGKYL